jgi:hypothetical protein
MPPADVEERLGKVEDGLSEWAACTRVRLSNFSNLTTRMLALHNSSKEYWKAKAEAVGLIWEEMETALTTAVKDKLGGEDGATRLKVLHDELSECLKESEIVGFFPVGGQWGKQVSIDLRLRPSLQALRLCSLVRHDLNPLLKEIKAPQQIWVPASQAEMSRKRKRRSSEGAKGGKGGGKRRT